MSIYIKNSVHWVTGNDTSRYYLVKVEDRDLLIDFVNDLKIATMTSKPIEDILDSYLGNTLLVRFVYNAAENTYKIGVTTGLAKDHTPFRNAVRTIMDNI